MIDPTGRATVQVRTRPDAAGDLYRYRSETRFVQKDDQGGQSQENSLVFDLEVLSVEPDGLRLRYTLREGKLIDSGGASMSAAMDAAVGGSLDFRLGLDGRLAGVETWPAYKARLLARLDAALPEDDPIRRIVHERMDQPPLAAAQEMVLGDVRILAAMELRGALPLGLTELSGQRGTVPVEARLEASVVKPGCVVRVRRETSGSASDMSRAIVTQADLALADGRALTLEERRVSRTPRGSQEETVTITRLSPAPAC